jgi:Panthothenate synthetase
LREANALAARELTTGESFDTLVFDGFATGGGVVDCVRVMQPVSLRPHFGAVPSSCVIAIAAKFGTFRFLDNIDIDIPRE